jgi:hypothetical protein
MMLVRILLCSSLWMLAGWGLGPLDQEGGGSDGLPQSGAGPYRFAEADFETTADEPYVFAEPIVSLTDPAVRVTDEGAYEIFYTRSDDEGSQIWKVTLERLDTLPEKDPTLVLAASEDWEQGHVRAPSVVARGSEIFLYYAGGETDPAIGLAYSSDGGASFTKESSNPILTAATDPDTIIDGETWLMVAASPGGQRIALHQSTDGRTFSEGRSLVEARLGRAGAFDALGMAGPALRVRTSPAGRAHYGLFYAGLSENTDGDVVSGIGYQGSYDLQSWSAFLQGEPILQAGPAGAGGPAPVLGAAEALLFVHQPRQGRGRLAVSFGP